MSLVITEVDVILNRDGTPNRPSHFNLEGFANFVIAGVFVVKDLRVLRRKRDDQTLVAMPSRKRWAICSHCRERIDLLDRYCRWCRTDIHVLARPGEEPVYRDIAHPIGHETRIYIERTILDAFDEARRYHDALAAGDASAFEGRVFPDPQSPNRTRHVVQPAFAVVADDAA